MAATGTILYRFRVRGGARAALESRNEVPLARELVVETDTGKMKLGDGTTHYNDLGYISGEVDIEGRVGFRRQGGWVQYTNDGEVTWHNLVALTDIKGDKGDQGDQGIPGPGSSCFPTASFDGGTGDIAVGSFCDLFVPFGFEITRSTLVADAAGTLQVDVRVVPYAAFPPGPSHSICGGNPPTLSGVNRTQDSTLSGWDTEIASGSVIRFFVTACTGIKRATLVLEGVRT